MRGILGEGTVRRHGVAALAMLAAIAVRFHRLVFEGIAALNDEVLGQYYPTSAGVFGPLRRGAFVSWSPEILFGYPVATTVELHIFSPFSGPLLMVAPHVALGVQMLLVQIVAAFAMYLLALRMGTSVTGAATAAILWVSGCPADNLTLVSMSLATVPWIPLVMLCWDHYGRGGDLRWALMAGGALGLAMLGGHMQFVYWTVLFLLGYLLFIVQPGGWRETSWRAARGTAVMCLVATAMAAATILPTTELLQDSIRASLAAAQRIHTGTLSLGETWRALGWTVFCGWDQLGVEGDVEFRSAGMLPVALALLAWGRGRKFDNRLLLLALGCLILSLGAVFAPAHWIVTALPGNNFRYPGRIGLFFTLAVVLLAGRAMDRLFAADGPRWPNVLALTGLAVLSAPRLRELLGSTQLARVSEGRLDLVVLILIGVCLAVPVHGRPRIVLRRLSAFVAIGWFVFHSRTSEHLVAPWVTARAWGHNAGFWDHRQPHRAPYPPLELQEVPRRDEHGPTRILTLDGLADDNLPLLTGHHVPTGLVSLRPGRVDRLVYARRVASDPEAPLEQALASNQTLLDLFNIQYLVIDSARFEEHFDAGQRSRSLSQRPSLGRFGLVENRTHLPRSFFVAHARAAKDEEAARDLITASTFDPRREVILEDGGEPSTDQSGPLFRPARVTAYGNQRVEVKVDAPRDGWLVLLDRWAPGWSAQTDGRPVPILRADYLFRAVRLTAGPHVVVFEYHNALFRLGLWISAVGIAFPLLAAVSLLRARRG
jgi:hypothetical protein